MNPESSGGNGEGDGPTARPEVSRSSLWFLRLVTVAVALVVLVFLVDAVRG